jgi:hypothetical protein
MQHKKKELRELCERLKKFGYRNHDRVRIYGDELELTSDPIASENGFAVEGVSCRSGKNKRVDLPLPVVQMIMQGSRH